MDTLTKRAQELETEVRAAIVAEGDNVETRELNGMNPEVRERLELRGRATLGAFLVAAIRGRAVTGAEAELQQAAGIGGIPLEMSETREVLEQRAREHLPPEQRAITSAPGTVGINLDVIRPAVFAPSIADKLMIEMPMVPSGTYATGTISTSVTADAVAKSANVPDTAGAITVGTTPPRRVGASLALTLEDIAAVGHWCSPHNLVHSVCENGMMIPCKGEEVNMARKRYSVEQIVAAVKAHENGMMIPCKGEEVNMARKRYSVEQIVAAVKAHENGTLIGDICRKMGISEATLYRWKKGYGGLEPDQVRELKQLREENERLKKRVAELSLDKSMLQDITRRKW